MKAAISDPNIITDDQEEECDGDAGAVSDWARRGEGFKSCWEAEESLAEVEAGEVRTGLLSTRDKRLMARLVSIPAVKTSSKCKKEIIRRAVKDWDKGEHQ